VNPVLKKQYGVDSMPETGENVAEDFHVSREDQDRFALRSQQRALAAQAAGHFRAEIVGVEIPSKRGEATVVSVDEHPRDTSFEALQKLPTPFRAGGTVTAGNASGVNDGACALVLASAAAAKRFGLTPRARVVGTAVAGVLPRIMGMGPVAATRKLLGRLGMSVGKMDLIELNEAFAAQALAVLRELKIADDAAHVNAQGGAIALGHPLGASGARLVTTAVNQLERGGGRYALCTMCIGVGQGIAMVVERVAAGRPREPDRHAGTRAVGPSRAPRIGCRDTDRSSAGQRTRASGASRIARGCGSGGCGSCGRCDGHRRRGPVFHRGRGHSRIRS
jgi:acetyl-CoA acyltransferase